MATLLPIPVEAPVTKALLPCKSNKSNTLIRYRYLPGNQPAARLSLVTLLAMARMQVLPHADSKPDAFGTFALARR